MEHPQFFPGISNCHDDTGGYSHDITGHLEELGDPICRPTGVLGWQAHPIPWINSLKDFKKSYNNGSQIKKNIAWDIILGRIIGKYHSFYGCVKFHAVSTN